MSPQRRHLRLILSPKGAVRHSKAALTAYSVAQRCRATLKGGTYGAFRRPKVPCDTQRRHLRDFSSPESTATNYPVSKMRRSAHENDSEDSPVSRTRRSAHETTLADLFVSRTRLFAHKTDSEDPFVSRMRLFAHETTSEGHSVSRTHRSAHETSLADLFVSKSHCFAHEATSADPPVSRMRRLTHETTSELSCATGTLRGLYGNSTDAPQCRRGETRASATHRETWCLSGR